MSIPQTCQEVAWGLPLLVGSGEQAPVQVRGLARGVEIRGVRGWAGTGASAKRPYLAYAPRIKLEAALSVTGGTKGFDMPPS